MNSMWFDDSSGEEHPFVGEMFQRPDMFDDAGGYPSQPIFIPLYPQKKPLQLLIALSQLNSLLLNMAIYREFSH